MPVRVPKAVLDGIKAVRDSGETNMFDRITVIELASNMGYFDAANWIMNHKREYAHGITGGFEDEAG